MTDPARIAEKHKALRALLAPMLRNTTAGLTPQQQVFVLELVVRVADSAGRIAADTLLADATEEIRRLKAEHADALLLAQQRIAALEAQQLRQREGITNIAECFDALGIMRGATISSLQRRLRVGAPDAMRLFALRGAVGAAFAELPVLPAEPEEPT